MCGIAGVVAWDERYKIDQQSLARMGDAIAHRGPDGRDIWLSSSNPSQPAQAQCGLAFARLAILDLDPRAMQPMTDGKRWLVFNGEIYNFRELQRELTQLDPHYQWKTTGDSEVILRAFDLWGENCVRHMSGMFAFAIWDPRDLCVFLARDRMGQKPLYFTFHSGCALAFASELPALLTLPWIDSQIDPASVAEYLQSGYIAAPATIYRGVAKLPPASFVRCAPGWLDERQKIF